MQAFRQLTGSTHYPALRGHAAALASRSVHPIERLRYVARGGWAGSSMLAAEAGWALGDLAASEAQALLPACRRLLDRQPGLGALWWLAARVLCAQDPASEARRCARELEDDPTPSLVFEALPSGARAVRRGGVGEVASADLVVVQVDALGSGGMVVDASSHRLLDAAAAAQVPVWVQTGVGQVLPPRLWEALSRRVGTRSMTASAACNASVVGHFGAEQVVGPLGAQPLDLAIRGGDCPEPPELVQGF